MQLNSGQAWNDATRMIKANREVVLVLAGVFFFVPLMVLFLFVFGSGILSGLAGAEPDPEVVSKQVNTLLFSYWWVFALVAIGQLAGAIALLALLGDRDKPTVGDVIGMIPKLILTMIAAQFISAMASQALPSLTQYLPAATQGIVSLIVLPISIYIAVKFSLTSAVIAVDKERNPITALKQSWTLTKGNSLRIFAFYFLLTVTAIVIGLLVALVTGLVFAALGERFYLIGNAVIISGLIAGFYALAYAVTAAIHRQLSGPSSSEVAGTFD